MAELTRFQISRRADTRGLGRNDRVHVYPFTQPSTQLIQDIVEALASEEGDGGRAGSAWHSWAATDSWILAGQRRMTHTRRRFAASTCG